MSYKTFFSVSAGPFSVVLRPRVAGHVTLRFFAKRLFSRGLWFLSFPFACKSCQIVYTIYWPHGHPAYIGSYSRNIECHEQKRHGAAYPDDNTIRLLDCHIHHTWQITVHECSEVKLPYVDVGKRELLPIACEIIIHKGREPMCVITHPQQAIQQHTGNDILAQVKRQHKDIKDIIRVTFPQEKWINYGVFDKR